MSTINIAGKTVGPGYPGFIIAEIGLSHDGSLGMAQAYIDAAAAAGADAIKFQTHIAEHESTLDEMFRIPLSGQDKTRYDYWKRTEFKPEEWASLRKQAHARGLAFLSSAFSVEAVEMLGKIGNDAWKIASGEFWSDDLIAAATKYWQPIILSTGMSSFADIQGRVDQFKKQKTDFALLQCTSKYPSRLEEIGLNVIDDFRAEFDCVAGLSDHSGSISPGLMALAKGADIIEIHVVFNKRMYGPDVIASVTLEELGLMCRARDSFHAMQANPVDKDAMAEELNPMRKLFSKSLAPKSALKKGTVLSYEMLTFKKPGTGILAQDLDKVLDRTLAKDVSPARLLTWEDLEQKNA
jgi:N-acetylneuraminate synthase